MKLNNCRGTRPGATVARLSEPTVAKEQQMSTFFSYPYNYLEDYPPNSAAGLVSDNNHDSFAPEGTIKFSFSKKRDIDSIFVLSETSAKVNVGNTPEPIKGGTASSARKHALLLDYPIPIPEGGGEIELTFGGEKIYEVYLMKKELSLNYDSPGEASGQSSFSEIGVTDTQEGMLVHEDLYGDQMEYRQYGYRAKYSIAYTAPLQTIEAIRALQQFRDENLNFTFAQDIRTYPERIFAGHFSSFELPMEYTLGHLSQWKRYTINFTVTEN